jgi:TetR/AcrR family tetracycline transcriptional repressor
MPKKTRVPLNRERIFDAALAVADRDGASAVTMRAVARQLGVEAMSLYHHIRDREDLLDGLAETLVRTGLPAPSGKLSAPALLIGFARGIRATALAHPEAFYLVGLRPLRSPEAAGAIERLLTALGSAGMSPELAVTSYRVVAAYARGYALSETAGLTFGPGVDTPHPAELERYAAALGRDTQSVFEAGLSAIIDGLTPKRPSSRRN